jgi:tripartite-type tricarboxylate transporter receptor subunit TctC
VAKGLTKQLGQPVIVVNRPGASGDIATREAARAAPDGHTLLMIGPANAINATAGLAAGFDFTKEIAPIAGATREALVMVVHPAVTAKSVAEFVALAKAAPQTIKMASTGTGSAPHVTGALFNTMAGLDLPIVHYGGGGPALKGMIAGEAQMMFEPMSAAIEPVKSGRLRALGVSTATRSPQMPDTPPVGESVRGFEASAVTGIGAPARTPADILQKLNRAMNDALADPAFAAELEQTGGAPLPGPAAAFAAILAGEISKWGAVVKAGGIKLGQ